MSYIQAIVNEVTPAAPGAIQPVVERAIRTAAIEFFRDSTAWRHTAEYGVVIEGQRSVGFSLPIGTSIVRVYWARFDNKDLRAVSLRWIARDDRRGEPEEYAVVTGTGEIQLYPIPLAMNANPGITSYMAVMPGFDTDDIPDVLVDRYRNALVQGAIRNLLIVPGSPWSDPALAQSYAYMFENEKAVARRMADADQAPVARAVRYGGL